MLRTVPPVPSVQFIFRPIVGSDKSRVCSIWCASSRSALRPSSGACPACDARPIILSRIAPMPAVVSESRSDDTSVPSQENTASCSAPSFVRIAREPGELTSSSALIKTVMRP